MKALNIPSATRHLEWPLIKAKLLTLMVWAFLLRPRVRPFLKSASPHSARPIRPIHSVQLLVHIQAHSSCPCAKHLYSIGISHTAQHLSLSANGVVLTLTVKWAKTRTHRSLEKSSVYGIKWAFWMPQPLARLRSKAQMPPNS